MSTIHKQILHSHFGNCMFYKKLYRTRYSIKLIMLSTITTKSWNKKVLKWVFSGFSIYFISILIFILVHDVKGYK